MSAPAIPPGAPTPFNAWQLRAQRLIKNVFLAQGQYPNISPLTVTITPSAANLPNSSIVTDSGVSPNIGPNFVPPNIPMNDGRFSLCNGFGLVSQGSGNYVPQYMPLEGDNSNPPASHGSKANAAAMGWAFEFGSDAEAIGLCVRGGQTGTAASSIRVKCDGQWVGAAQLIPSGFSNYYEIVYSLGTGKGGPHNWKVYCTNNSIAGVNVGLAAGSIAANNPFTIWAVPKFDTPMVVCLTDSYGGTMPLDTTDNDPHQPFNIQFADFMGWDSILTYAASGQGFINPSLNSGLTFSQTIGQLSAGLPAASNADFVAVCMGYNDLANGKSAAQIQAAATSALPLVRAQFPNAFIGVWGTWNTPAANSSTAIDTGIHNAVAAVNDPHMAFFSTMGQYNSTLPYQFPGNAAWASKYILSVDNIHETDVGGRRIGMRMANDLLVWLRAQSGVAYAAP